MTTLPSSLLNQLITAQFAALANVPADIRGILKPYGVFAQRNP